MWLLPLVLGRGFHYCRKVSPNRSCSLNTQFGITQIKVFWAKGELDRIERKGMRSAGVWFCSCGLKNDLGSGELESRTLKVLLREMAPV